MNDYLNEVEALVQEIKAAFADVPYPGDENITGTTFPWDEGVSDYFRGTTQEGHEVKNLRLHSAALSFFLPEAYHYYLPAFVIAVLQDPEEADAISDSLVVDFSGRDRTREIIQRLSPPQRRAMLRYFQFDPFTSGESFNSRLSRAISNLQAHDKM